jgi:hypothetical protein
LGKTMFVLYREVELLFNNSFASLDKKVTSMAIKIKKRPQ